MEIRPKSSAGQKLRRVMKINSDTSSNSKTMPDRNRWRRSRLRRSGRLARSAVSSDAIAQALRPIQRAYKRHMLANYSPSHHNVGHNKLLGESILAGKLATSGPESTQQSGCGGETNKLNHGGNHTDSIKAKSRRHSWTWDKELESAQVSCDTIATHC